jgi:hypothetical protein
MKNIPAWLETTLSFLLIGMFFVAYLVVHVPQKKIVPQPVSETNTEILVFNHSLTIGTQKLQVAYASTPSEQQQGLSDTSSLTDNQGMLFIFPTATSPSFWMKDMQYSLDIIWIGSDKKVVDITANLTPSTFPKSFSPKNPAQYVLEVNAGFVEKNVIQIGSPVSF